LRVHYVPNPTIIIHSVTKRLSPNGKGRTPMDSELAACYTLQ
jgi:hypothetical protein